MKNEEKDLFDSMRNKLENKNFDFKEAHWNQFEKLLDGAQPKPGIPWLRLSFLAGAVLLMLSSAVYFFTGKGDSEKINPNGDNNIALSETQTERNNSNSNENGNTNSDASQNHDQNKNQSEGGEEANAANQNSEPINADPTSNEGGSVVDDEKSTNNNLNNNNNNNSNTGNPTIAAPVADEDINININEGEVPSMLAQSVEPGVGFGNDAVSGNKENNSKSESDQNADNQSSEVKEVTSSTNDSNLNNSNSNSNSKPNSDSGNNGEGNSSKEDNTNNDNSLNPVLAVVDDTNQNDDANSNDVDDKNGNTDSNGNGNVRSPANSNPLVSSLAHGEAMDGATIDKSNTSSADEDEAVNSTETKSSSNAEEKDPSGQSNLNSNPDNNAGDESGKANDGAIVNAEEVIPADTMDSDVKETVPPVPEEDKADDKQQDSIALNRSFFVIGGTNLYQSYTNLGLDSSASMSLDPSFGIGYQHDLTSKMGFSVGLNYFQKTKLNSMQQFESVFYGFDVRREVTTIQSEKLHFAGLRAGMYVRLFKGTKLTAEGEYNRLITSMSQIDNSVQAGTSTPQSTTSSRDVGYVNGFAKNSLMLHLGFQKDITSRLKVFGQQSIGISDITVNTYYGNNVKDRNIGIRFGLQYALIDRKKFKMVK